MARKRGHYSIQKVIEFYRLLAKGIRESLREWEEEKGPHKPTAEKNQERGD